jgi:hypothetical protein
MSIKRASRASNVAGQALESRASSIRSTLQSIDNNTQYQAPDVEIDADESSIRTDSEEES